jgi:hypothetical protein
MLSETLFVDRIEIGNDRVRLAVIKCPHCRTKSYFGRKPKPVEHIHGAGQIGEDLLPFEGGRGWHCDKDRAGEVKLLFRMAQIIQYGTAADHAQIEKEALEAEKVVV